ncbi:hypothetical protein E4U03_04660 [Rothia nasimurium]|uniref:Head-to-tail adaptor n=1 Tax=Rothia nasimurium TaxID=85336 RepID=A0A4Y9F5F4_9MICC|nr:hypothetical protein [Rothia nasimurium]MBF0807909.1 hypothetical protein [Rothia nasimurium]TFU22911.1 hypothetical protein E4U03_04660 [Rothia nasimurium]
MVDPSIFPETYLQQLAARAGEPIVTDQDVAEARQALASVLVLVQYHGSPMWGIDNMPPVAHQVLIEASARLYMNLGGFVSERADAASLERDKAFAQGAYLTPAEIDRLEDAAGKKLMRGALRSVPISNPDMPIPRSRERFSGAWGQHDGSVPIGYPYPIPYAPGDEYRGLVPYQGRGK